jgi:hypothetical protein
MTKLENENLIKLILSSFTYFKAKDLFDNFNNKTLNQVILRIISFENFSKP